MVRKRRDQFKPKPKLSEMSREEYDERVRFEELYESVRASVIEKMDRGENVYQILDLPEPIGHRCKENYKFSTPRLLHFSIFYFIGNYLAPYITFIIPSILCTVIGYSGLFFFILAQGGLVNWNSLLYVWPVTGITLGAGFAHLSIPSEPFLALSTFILFWIMRWVQIESRLICFFTVIFSSLLSHLIIGLYFGWLTPTYNWLTAVYTLAPLIPVVLADYSITPFKLIAVPLIPIVAKCVAYEFYGVPKVT